MDFDTEILVVGGGLIGSAMAIALSSIGFDVTVIDRQSDQVSKTHVLMEEHMHCLTHLFEC